MNKLIASLYLAQCSPIAAFRLVYKGSRSMRWALVGALVVFTDNGAEAPFNLEVAREVDIGCEIESDRLRAAGSMSGIVDW